VKNYKFILVLILGAVFIVVIYGVWVEPYRLEIKHIQINNSGLKNVLGGKTAIFISDLHIAKIGKRETSVLKAIDLIGPDLILLGGDFIKWNGDHIPALSFLAKLKAGDGVWAVMGDYDYSNSRNSCDFCHERGSVKSTNKHNMRFLRDSIQRISLSKGVLLLGGIDMEFDLPKGEEELLPLTANTPTLVISHSPLAFEYFDEDQDILVLAGDTHGGQIPFPAWFWKIFGYEKNARYNQGWFKKGNKQMYVSRGIGTSHWPIRIMRRPEVVVLHF